MSGDDVLIHGRGARIAVWLAFAVVVGLLVVAPIVVTIVTALSTQWNGVLPAGLTTDHLSSTVRADTLASIAVSVQTAVVASAAAVFVGTWAAIAAHDGSPRLRRTIDGAFHLPVAVPSVVVGLGVLIAFSKPPLVLNGTPAIVMLVQFVLVLSFAYSTVSGAVGSMDPGLVQAAESLGASGWRVLTRIRLPLLAPSIAAAAGLALALCMGELGATIMVYPASWRTLPVTIFTLTDRGNLFDAAAATVFLLLVTVVILGLLGRLRSRGGAARAAV